MSLIRRILKSEMLEAVVASGFAAYLRAAFATTRWQYSGVAALTDDLERHGAVIVVCWHQRIMFSAPAWKVTGRALAGIHSRSRAGRLAGAIQARLGLQSVPMHDNKSNRAMSLATARLMKSGVSLGLAADGPLGPARVLNPAVLEWARLTGAPVWCQAFSVRRAWTWSSWDACLFPWPVNRGAIVYQPWDGTVPRRLDDAERQRLAAGLAAALDAVTARADALAGARAAKLDPPEGG